MKTLAGFLGLVRRLIRPMRTVAALAAVPSLILIAWLIYTVGFNGWLRGGLTTTGILLLATPSILLWAFYAALQQLSDVPEDILNSVSQGWERSRSAMRGIRASDSTERSKIGLLRGVYLVGRTAIDARGLLIDSAGLIRLLNPLTLMIVLGALVATVILWIVVSVIVVVTVLT